MTTRRIIAVVPQGSCLPPTHDLTYVNDLITTLKAKLGLFADDTMFAIQNKNTKCEAIQLKHQLNLALKFFHLWCIKINLFKTVRILFGQTNTTNRPNCPNRLSYDRLVQLCQVFRFTFGSKFNFNKHINNITIKATLNRGILCPIPNRTSPIRMKNRHDLLKLHVSRILTYTGPSWVPLITYSQ